MNYDIRQAEEILTRTPRALDALLRGLSTEWITCNEGVDTWSPFDVVGHLIHGERTDWIPRVEHILRHGESAPFPPFDRFAQLTASRGKSLIELLDTFAASRAESLSRLSALNLTSGDLDRCGAHPALGRVTMRQLLATWVAHDLDHIYQISRVIAHQYSDAVGPWRRYLRIIGDSRTTAG